MYSRIGTSWRIGRQAAIVFALATLMATRGRAWGQIITPPIINPPIGPFSPSIGWKPLVRNQNSSLGLTWMDFDWTGLLYTVTPAYAAGASGTPPQPTTSYGQLVGLTSFGLQDINSLGVAIEAHGNPITYKWQWFPPSVPRDQSQDWQNFPAPALFVLGRVDSSLSGSASGPTTVTGHLGVTGMEWMKCNPDSEILNIVGGGTAANPLLTNGTASLLSRAVLSAGNSSTPQVTITPTAEATGATAPDPLTGRPTGFGSVGIGAGGKGFPITLFTPYPFSLPQMGGAGNKFVYDNTFPDGILTLSLVSQVVGAGQSDTQWLADNNKVGWAIHPSIDGWIPYTQKMGQGDKVFPVTNGQMNVALYKGLPDSDAGFGLKEVLLKVQGLDSQKAYIQTFFSATAFNHPNSTFDFTIMSQPNWFYYYNKMYLAAPAVYENGNTSHCDSDTTTDPQPYHFATVTGVYIDNDAFGRGEVYVFVPGATHLQIDGILFVSGIHNYLATVGHELGHKWDIEHGLVNRKYRGSDAWNQGFDFDGDGILNSAEDANGLDPRNSDTTGFMSGSINGDVEVLAQIHGLARLIPNKDAWKRDWSASGLQYTGLFDPFWGPDNPDRDFRNYWGWPQNPTSVTYFPWDYQTGVTFGGAFYLLGSHYPDPSGSAVTRVKDPFQNPYNGGTPYPGRHIP